MLTEDFRKEYAQQIEDGSFLDLLTMLKIAINQSKLNLTADRDTQNYYLILEDRDGQQGDRQQALNLANTILQTIDKNLPKMMLRDGDLEFEPFHYDRYWD